MQEISDYTLRYHVRHLIDNSSFDRAAGWLIDIAFLEMKTKRGMAYELADDFELVIDRLPQDHSKRQQLALLHEALLRDIQFIERHPTTLFQCLWNSCWWYDCPDAAEYHNKGQDVAQAVGLHMLLEQWRNQKEAAKPGFFWLRSLRPSPSRLGENQLRDIRVHTESVLLVKFSPDGTQLASYSVDGTARVMDVTRCRQLACMSELHGHPVDMTFADDNHVFVALAESGNHINVFEVFTRQHVAALDISDASIEVLRISPDGTFLVGISREGAVYCWDIASGNRKTIRKSDKKRNITTALWHLTISSDQSRIVWTEENSSIYCWDVRSLRMLHSAKFGAEHFFEAFASNGYTAVWSEQSGLMAYDIQTQKLRRTAQEDALGFMTRMAMSSDATIAVSASSDNVITVWNLLDAAIVARFVGHEHSIESIALSQDHRFVASSSADTSIRIWDCKGSQAKTVLNEHSKRISCCELLPDANLLATGSDDEQVLLWNTSDGKIAGRLVGHSGSISKIRSSHDQKWLFSCSDDATIRMWDVRKQTGILCIGKLPRVCEALAISNDNTLLVGGCADSMVRIWELPSGNLLACLKGHELFVQSVTISADGRTVASVGGDGKIRVWDVAHKRQIADIRQPGDLNISCPMLAFLGKSKHLAFLWGDNTVRVWDIAGQKELSCRWLGEGHIIGFSVSEDGDRIVTMHESNKVIVLDSGSCEIVDEYPGLLASGMDVEAAAREDSVYPWRPMINEQEAAIVSRENRIAVAWCPQRLLSTVSKEGRWIYTSGKSLYMFCLEGDLQKCSKDGIEVSMAGMSRQNTERSGTGPARLRMVPTAWWKKLITQ